MGFRENVNWILAESGISQGDLARKLNKSPQNVSVIFKHNRPNMTTLLQFSEALEVEVSDLTKAHHADEKQQTGGAVDVGGRLKSVLTEKRMTAYELCKLSGVAQSTIGRLLSGKNKPSETTCMRLALKLGVNYLWLETGEGDKSDLSGNLTSENEGLNGDISKIEIGEAYLLFKSAQTDSFDIWLEKFQSLKNHPS